MGPQVNAVPHPFNLSHLSQALSQPGPVGPMHAPHQPMQQMHHQQADLGAQWDRFQQQPQQGPAQWHQPQQQQQQQSGWADSFATGKGKGREMSPMPMEQPYQPQMMPPNPFAGGGLQTYQPRLQPMYAQQLQQPAPLQAGHAEMEAAFERALADARAQSAPAEEAKEEVKEDTTKTEDAKEQEPTEGDFKGELDAVWESLKPEAERLNQLAEWEKEFSQVGGGRQGVGVGRVKEGVGVHEDVDMFQEWRELLLERERALKDMMMGARSRSSSISAASDQLRPISTSPQPIMRTGYESGSDRQCSCSSCELEQQLGVVENTLSSSSSLPLSHSRTLQRGEVRSSGGWFPLPQTPLL